VWFSEASQMIADDLESINLFNETVTITSGYYDNFADVYDSVSIEVDIGNAILMQSTGLKDINGTEIYEGDILKHIDFDSNQDTVNVVYMKHGSLVFDVEVDEFVYDVPVYRLHPETSGGYEDTLEIIGNIYINPELLEVAE